MIVSRYATAIEPMFQVHPALDCAAMVRKFTTLAIIKADKISL